MKYIFFSCFYINFIFAFPYPIDDFAKKSFSQIKAIHLKDIIKPNTKTLEEAYEIYENEEKDLKASLKLLKYRVLQSKNQNFELTRNISLSDILIDSKNIKELHNVKQKNIKGLK